MSEGSQKKSFIEEIEIAGDQLLDRVRDLVREGNVRHIRIKHDGRVVMELPMTLAVVGGLIAPVVAALGAFAAAITRCTIEVVREEPDTDLVVPPPSPGAPER